MLGPKLVVWQDVDVGEELWVALLKAVVVLKAPGEECVELFK